ncbi:Dockerin type I repeat protein [Anatilimnocola aggregata]|uniref:Dockerin type I repeat protein n=1 Tax=Anatilimnocola aggregata TaxID=2528021 RepID=A0A517Y6A2_9BACT|nr:Ig-like domain-containing protein [Anatilimnocola aggregata]QDU25764.1 Dockerin type I repeat protein [Anatilimnocola aggregata]
MTTLGRRNRFATSSRTAAAQKLARQKLAQRRSLWAEQLESRELMAGDVAPTLFRSPFWNIQQPRDVNADGRVTAMDALRIINYLNVNGSRTVVSPAGAAAGEGVGPEPDSYLDVNNDTRISAMDALQVINQLNSGGTGDPMIKLTVQIVAAGTNDDLNTISKGGSYELRVLTEDLGVLNYMSLNRDPTLLDGSTALGVSTSFFDVLYSTDKTDVQVNESQIIFISGTPTTNGTFTLTVVQNGVPKTTAAIPFAANRATTAGNIQTALDAVLGGTATEVTHEPSGGNNRWRVRFLNQMSNQDVPEMTGNVTGLGTAAITITESIKGTTTNPAAYTDALKLRTRYDADGNPLNDAPPFFQDNRQGFRMATGINDVGGTQFFDPYQGTTPTEILRVRMNALDAGLVNFNLSLADIADGLETGVVGFGIPVTTDLIMITGDSLEITEPLNAGDDSATTTEGSVTPININVTSNDVNVAPTPNTAKTVISVDTTGTLGTVQIISASTIRYTPPGGDFNGIDTFKYTVRDQASPTFNTDVATVNITINAVNDAPTISFSGTSPQTFNEDQSRTFSSGGGNQITVNDVDAAAPALLTLTLNVGAGNGTLTLFGVTGLTNVTGNNSSTISAQGTLADLNNAINGLTYTPVPGAFGSKTLAVTINDNGNTGGAPQSSTLNIPLVITPINDAPTINVGFASPVANIEGDALLFSSGAGRLITVADQDSGSSPVVVTLAVNAANRINVPAATGVTIGTNNTSTVTLTGNVADVSAALNGFTYTSVVGFGGQSDTLNITINDQGNTGGGALTANASVTINVAPAVRPFAASDSLTVEEDSASGALNTVDVLANDLVNPTPVGTKARLLSFVGTTPNGGTVTRDLGTLPDDTDDKLIYVPAPDFFGADTISYTLRDTSGVGADSIGTVNVTVRPMNDAPTAIDDALSSIAEDSGPRTITAITLTGNDLKGPSNEAGQTLTITSVSNVVGGTASVVAGDVVFTPAADFNGTASFDYTIQDNGQTAGANDFKSDTGSATFTITEVNDAPVAVNDPIASIAEDSGTRTIPFASLLGNDTKGAANESGQTLNITSVTSGTGGTVSISGTNVLFTPTQDFNGAASFTYTVTDDGTTNGVANAKSANGTVTFSITAVNDAPDADDDTVTTGEGQQVDIAVLLNDSDVDASPTFISQDNLLTSGTTISIISGPSHGTASVVNGKIRYTPDAFYNGSDEITYQLNDNDSTTPGPLTSTIATVSITVQEKNDPPVAVADTATTNEDIAVSIDVFNNDSDPDTANTLWSFVPMQQPTHGTISFNPTTRRVVYTPEADYNGPDSFTYKINDNSPFTPPSLESNEVTVSITVVEVNDAPVAVNDPTGVPFTAIIDRPRDFNITTDLLSNDSKGAANESGQTLTLDSFQATTANGTVTRNGNILTYTPNPGYSGLDSFSYTIIDNGTTNGVNDFKTSTATVNIDVKNFIPTDVEGYVYIDYDNDGVFDANEKALSGAQITLAGTSLVTGLPIVPITLTTGMDGHYFFNDVEPGNYTLTEAAPMGLRDGKETAGLAAAANPGNANDVIQLTLPLFGIAGGVSVNSFGEGTIDANQLEDSQGLIGEILASSTQNGYVISTDLAGDAFWSWALNGWSNTHSIKVTLSADLSRALLECTDGFGNSFSTTIFQDPFNIDNPNRNNPNHTAAMARFRILGRDASDNYIIRLDGRATDFFGASGASLASVPVMSAGEATSAGEYTNGVDAAMAAGSWA